MSKALIIGSMILTSSCYTARQVDYRIKTENAVQGFELVNLQANNFHAVCRELARLEERIEKLEKEANNER